MIAARNMRRAALAILVAAGLVTGSAFAASRQTSPALTAGTFAVTTTPAVPAEDVAAAGDPADVERVLAAISSFGVDLNEIHHAQSAFGVDVFVSARSGGGWCVIYAQPVTTTQCGDDSSLEAGGWISRPDGSRLYVGLRPDGQTAVTTDSGKSIPVIGNIFVSDEPVR